MTVLVVDHGHTTVCGIRDLGIRIADRLNAGHVDCNSMDEYRTAIDEHDPTAVIVNYRPDLMPWWQPTTFPEFAVLHNYSPMTVDARAADLLDRCFDRVLVLDPTVTPTDPRVHAVGRPLPEGRGYIQSVDIDRPLIGSFGFAFPHKGFADVAAEVATLRRSAFALHMPEAYFNGVQGGEMYRPGILADVIGRMPGVPLIATWHNREPWELVDWLGGNTVNCLLYAPGQPDAGLSSALDYLIAARRPMLVSSAEMFAAAAGWAAEWPTVRLADVIDNLHHWEHQAQILFDITAGRFEANVNVILDAL